MASNRGYTTATKVRAVIGSKVINDFTDAVIEQAINRIEGVIDTMLKVGDGSTGAFSFTWATGESTHWVVEGAATYGAALQCLGPSIASWNTLEQMQNAQNICSFMFKLYMDRIIDEEDGSFIRDQ